MSSTAAPGTTPAHPPPPPSSTTTNTTIGGSPGLRPCEYKVGKVLGEGTYAKVKEAIHITTGKTYAAKIFNKKLIAGRERMVINEIKILQSVSKGHRNLLQLVDFFESQNNLYVITELAQGGELFYKICDKGHYTESDAAEILKYLCDTVAYLHSKGIVHRDLKPENLLFRGGPEGDENPKDLVIADFGLARCLESSEHPFLTTTCGTPGYMAPEILQRKTYGKTVDIWAIGVIAFFLLSGYTPFDRNSTASEIQAILKADYAFEPAEYWKDVSNTAKSFIRSCLKLSPEERLTAPAATLAVKDWLEELLKQERDGDSNGDVNKEAGSEAGGHRKSGMSNLLPEILLRRGSSVKHQGKDAFKRASEAARITRTLMRDMERKRAPQLCDDTATTTMMQKDGEPREPRGTGDDEEEQVIPQPVVEHNPMEVVGNMK